MRSGRSVQPEWGHVAPASSLRRVLGAVAVAVAVGATGSAAVVLSMLGNQDAPADRAMMAARASVPAGEAAPVIAGTQSAVSPAAATSPPAPPATAQSENAATPAGSAPPQPAAPPEKLADADASASPAAAAPADDAHLAGAHPARNAGLHRRFVPWGPPAFRRFTHSFFASFQSHHH